MLGYTITSEAKNQFFLKYFLLQIASLFQILEYCGHSGVLLATMGSFVVHFTTNHNRGSAFSVYIYASGGGV